MWIITQKANEIKVITMPLVPSCAMIYEPGFGSSVMRLRCQIVFPKTSHKISWKQKSYFLCSTEILTQRTSIHLGSFLNTYCNECIAGQVPLKCVTDHLVKGHNEPLPDFQIEPSALPFAVAWSPWNISILPRRITAVHVIYAKNSSSLGCSDEIRINIAWILSSTRFLI